MIRFSFAHPAAAFFPAAAPRPVPPAPGPAAPAAAPRLPFEAYLRHGAEAGIGWTELRRRVLRLLWGAARPLGAYETADRLRADGRRVAPVTVYRCLAAFEEAGLILPVVTWKRYLLSPDPARGWWGLLLCRSCGAATPVDLADAGGSAERALAKRGFVPRRWALECEGRCRACAGGRR